MHAPAEFAPDDPELRIRVRAALISLVAGTAIFGGKLAAYGVTQSSALLSDALESIVNVLAAAFLVGSVVFGGKPADRDHPYGHGKIEYFSAAFEGGLIAFASIAILVGVGIALWEGQRARELEVGMVISGAATAANALLGVYLLRVARRSRSLALEADGRHVLSDVATTIGVLAGLGVSWATGLWWLDPVIAGGVALHLGWAGFRLVRRAAGGLLDEEDTQTIEELLATLERERVPGLIRVHHLRSMRVGARTHVDAHLVMPEYWTVERSHVLCDALEHKLNAAMPGEVDVVFHADPCRQEHCGVCEVADCEVRREPFTARPPISLEEAVAPDPPRGRHRP
ncbi:MAG: cation transporter [Planctomycetes bacterium]|nr:cation transporter [Planctomycetota bacterium]